MKLFRVSGIKRLDYMNWLANVSMTAGSLYIVYNLYLLSLNETKLLGSTMSSIIALNLLVYDIYIKLLEQTEIRRENAIYEKQISLFQEQIYVKETAMLTMKKTWMLLYEQYTDDKLSREDFLLKRRSTMKKQPDWRKG